MFWSFAVRSVTAQSDGVGNSEAADKGGDGSAVTDKKPFNALKREQRAFSL
jgi:hypothetical protein